MGITDIKLVPKEFVKEGEPVILMHPNDYEKFKAKIGNSNAQPNE